MKNVFLIYAAVIVLFSSSMSWRAMLGSVTGGSGGSWSSHSTGGGGWASSGGGHK